ncbi:cupin domain-containing protein [Amycolatopsis sp. cg5]|uniref:cupin domain-containing protein n=1 Tax=Amycolatopsis sp. cg5 TaxID=3238802 RepID=UPI0035260B15
MHNVTIYRDVFGKGLHDGSINWTAYNQTGRSGVDVEWLYTGEQTGETKAEAYIGRFAPGSHGDLHEHLGFELLLVLEGELHNSNGDVYPPGTLILEDPTSIHQVSSPNGCVALVVREKGTRPLTAAEKEELFAAFA